MRLAELFCGAGGIAAGARQAGFATVFATDMDKAACDTFQKNFPNAKTVCGDIKELDLAAELPTEIDGLAFGSPCSNFSMVGDRSGLQGKTGSLYTYGVKALQLRQPKFFVFENVSGILSKGIEIIKQAMANAGYDLFQHHYKFEDYGIPQKRHRVIIVGFRKDLNIDFQHPKPTHANNHVGVRAACRDIPRDAANNEIPHCSDKDVEILQCIRPGENIWMAEYRLPKHLIIKTKAKISQAYRRTHPEQPAYTLTASGGGGRQGYHWQENRPLTNRERARIQTFPDDFEFSGSYAAVRKQIGMSVPPLGAKIIFQAIREALA